MEIAPSPASAESASDRPFGVTPARSRGPLIAAWLLFALWLAGILLLAVRFPARH